MSYNHKSARILRSTLKYTIKNILTKIGFFSIYLILPAALGPGVYLASNRNEYRGQKCVSGDKSVINRHL
jgi:hypothetical protein